MDTHSVTLLKKEQLERDLQGQSMSREELQDSISQLEQELEGKTHTEQQLTEVGGLEFEEELGQLILISRYEWFLNFLLFLCFAEAAEA